MFDLKYDLEFFNRVDNAIYIIGFITLLVICITLYFVSKEVKE